MSQQAARQTTNRPHWDHTVRHIKGSDSLMKTKWEHTYGKSNAHTLRLGAMMLYINPNWNFLETDCMYFSVMTLSYITKIQKSLSTITDMHTCSFTKFLEVVPCQRSQPWLEQICLPWPTCFSPTGCDQSTLRKIPTSWRTSVIRKC